MVAMAALLLTTASNSTAQCPAAPAGVRLEVTTIPRAGEGGADETDSIAGTAVGVILQDARVVIYAHAGDRWWVQPLATTPLTEIRAEGRWQTTTHLGFEYAALLVHKSHSPEGQRFALPAVGGCIWAAVMIKGRVQGGQSEPARGSAKVIRFSGHDWTVKSGHAGPGPNNFSDGEENVRIDSDGRLHLRITYRDGQWYCAEVVNQKSLGYGTYRFFIRSSTSGMDPNVVLGLFTWNDDPAFAHRELDIEISRWGKRDNEDAQFVVQPWDSVGNLKRFSMPPTVSSIHSFTWHPAEVLFDSREPNGNLIQEHRFSNGIPQAGGENARINLWLVNGSMPQHGLTVEVLLEKFEFIPNPN
jgi:hypothetical protein